MPNPMMQMLQRSSRRPNNPLAMLGEFRKFAAGMTPQKAQQEVERLLQSGQMSQAQFQQLQEQAKEFMQFLK
jgi:hypothetical protein|nr:MAG TPA: hypothetical protein [Caudoviricetes sp.]